jgi:hypothetical protein
VLQGDENIVKTFFAIVWFLTVTSAFVLGYGWGVGERFESVERVVLFDHNQQFKQAIYDGIPFKLKGSDISIFPRKDGHIDASITDWGVKENRIRQISE